MQDKHKLTRKKALNIKIHLSEERSNLILLTLSYKLNKLQKKIEETFKETLFNKKSNFKKNQNDQKFSSKQLYIIIYMYLSQVSFDLSGSVL